MSANDIGSSEKSSSALSAEAAEFVPTSVSNGKSAATTNRGQGNEHLQALVENVGVVTTTPVNTSGWKNGIAGGGGLSSSSSPSSLLPHHSVTASLANVNMPPPMPYMMNCFPFLPQNNSIRPQLTRFPPPYNIPPDLPMSNGIVPSPSHQDAAIPLVGHQLNPAHFNGLPTDPSLGLHTIANAANGNNRHAHHPGTAVVPNPSWVVSLGQHPSPQQQFISAASHHPQQQPPPPLQPPSRLRPRFQQRFPQHHQHHNQQYNNTKQGPQNKPPVNVNHFQNRPPNQFLPNFAPPPSHIPPPQQQPQPHPHHLSPVNQHHNNSYHNRNQPITSGNQSILNTSASNDKAQADTVPSSSFSSPTTKSSALVIQTAQAGSMTTTSVTSTSSSPLSSSVSNSCQRNALTRGQRDTRTGMKKTILDSERPSSPVLISRSSQTDKIPLGVKDLTLRQKPHPLFIKNQSASTSTTVKEGNSSNKKKETNKAHDTCDNSSVSPSSLSSSTCNTESSIVEEVVFDQWGCVSVQASPSWIDSSVHTLNDGKAIAHATIIAPSPKSTAAPAATTSISVTTRPTTTTTTAFTSDKKSSRTPTATSVSYSSKLSSTPLVSHTDKRNIPFVNSSVISPSSTPLLSSSSSAWRHPHNNPALSVIESRGTTTPAIFSSSGSEDKASHLKDKDVKNDPNPVSTTETGKRRRRSGSRKKRGQENVVDSEDSSRNASRGVSGQLPRQFGMIGGWEKNDDKIDLQSWTDFPPMNNNSAAKPSSSGGGGGGGGQVRSMGQGQDHRSGSSFDQRSSSSNAGHAPTSDSRRGNRNNNDDDLSTSGPVLIQRVQGGPPWSLKEQQQQRQYQQQRQHQQQQSLSVSSGGGQRQANPTVPASSPCSTSSSLPLKSYATTTAARGGRGRDNVSVNQPVSVHSSSSNTTTASSVSSSSFNNNSNTVVPSKDSSHQPLPVRNDERDYPPLSSSSLATTSSSHQNRLQHQQQPALSHSRASSSSSYLAKNNNKAVNGAISSQSHVNSSQFPHGVSSKGTSTHPPNNNNNVNTQQAMGSTPSPYSSAKESNTKDSFYNTKSSPGQVARGKSKSPGRDFVKNVPTVSGLPRNSSKSPARFLHADSRDVDSAASSLSYADKSKIKDPNPTGRSIEGHPKNSDGVSDCNEEEEGGGEDDDEKSTTKRRRQRRRRRNHVRTKKGSGGGEYIMTEHNDGVARSMNGEDGGDMMLHFEDTEEFPDLLSSVSRGHSQDVIGDRSSLSGTSLSYSDMAKGSWSRREQSLSRNHSLTGSCVSEDNMEDGTETKRARKRRKRREQANKAAETELAEISLEQELLREGLKKTGGLRGPDRWKNQTSSGLITSPAVVREVKKGGGQSQGSGKKSKQPIALDLAAMIEASKSKLEKHSPKSSVKGDSRSSSAKRSTHSTSQSTRAANPLDSTAPSQRRGKEREFPKSKKPSPLKKVILKEREAKKQLRLMDGKDMDEFGNPHGVGMVGVDSELSQDALSSKSEETDVERAAGSSQPTNLSADLSPISQTSPISMSPASPGNSGVNSPVAGSVGRDSVIQKIHSRRFREYCNQVLDKEIDQCCTDLLQDLVRFQDRLYHKDPMRAKRKRRVVLGLREVTKHLRLKKIKCVVISPNLEKIQSKGGLDEALNTILSMCQEQDVPFVFALGRRALGRACAKLVPVSVVGIFSYQNCEENYNRLVSLTAHARSSYNEMVEAVEKEVAAASTFSSVPGLIPAHMGHSRTPSGCSAISFTSSVISEPHSEYYSSYADELRISDGNAKNNQAQGYSNDLDDGNEADVEDFGGDPGRKRRLAGGSGGGLRGSNSVRFDDTGSGSESVSHSTATTGGGLGNGLTNENSGAAGTGSNDVAGTDAGNAATGNNTNNSNSVVIGDGNVGKAPSSSSGVNPAPPPHPLHHNHNHHNHIHGHHRRQSSVSSLARIMEGIDDDKEDAVTTTTTAATTVLATTTTTSVVSATRGNSNSVTDSGVNECGNAQVDGGEKVGSGGAVEIKVSSSVDVRDGCTSGLDVGGGVGEDGGRQKVMVVGGGVLGKGESDGRDREEQNEDDDEDEDVDVVDDVGDDEDEEDEEEEEEDEEEAAVANSRSRLRGHTRQKSMDKKERIENWLSAQSNLSSME